MDKLGSLLLIHAWLILMVYGFISNRDGHLDRANFDRFGKSSWLRWLLAGRSQEQFMMKGRLNRAIMVPFTICFYILFMWGILPGHGTNILTGKPIAQVSDKGGGVAK